MCLSEPTFPGCIVPVDPIGLFRMEDEAGPDDTLLCVPLHDPGWNGMKALDDLPQQVRSEIEHFFSVYKDLDPDRHATVHGWGSREDALAEIEESRGRHRKARAE